jgi:hypothetical protein
MEVFKGEYKQELMRTFAGFFAGWIVFLDYIMCSGLLSVISAAAMNTLVPFIPRWIWILVLITFATSLNPVRMGLTWLTIGTVLYVTMRLLFPRAVAIEVWHDRGNSQGCLVEKMSHAASGMHSIAVLRLSSLQLAFAHTGSVLAC